MGNRADLCALAGAISATIALAWVIMCTGAVAGKKTNRLKEAVENRRL